jgi:hypothetical protein
MSGACIAAWCRERGGPAGRRPRAARADLFKFWVLSRVSSTERAKARLWENQFIDFGYEVPDHMMAMLLGLVFCIVAPPIAVIAAAYFLVNSIIARYQVCYVYTPRFETGGQARPPARRDGAQRRAPSLRRAGSVQALPTWGPGCVSA